jgi:yecA family protein
MLDKFLRSNSLPGGCTSLSMADGFITALIVGQYEIPRKANQGLEVVWGDTSNIPLKERKWTKQEKAVLAELHRFADHNYYLLQDELTMYAPLIGSRLHYSIASRKEDQNFPFVVQWCHGFVKAFNIAPGIWKRILDTETGRLLIAPLIYFGTSSGWSKEMEDKYNLQPYRNRFAEQLQYLVYDIKAHFSNPLNVDGMSEFLSEISSHWTIPEEYMQTKVTAA